MKLPEITSLEKLSDGVRLQMSIGSELDAFEGHFDKIPIVPGVVQISWVIIFARTYIMGLSEFTFNSIEKLKFQNVIQPEMMVTLDLNYSNGNLFFAFTSNSHKHSSGKIVIGI